MDAGLLLVRVVLGAIMTAHGGQKLSRWLGGHGIVGTSGWLEPWASGPLACTPQSSDSPSSEAARFSLSVYSLHSGRPRSRA